MEWSNNYLYYVRLLESCIKAHNKLKWLSYFAYTLTHTVFVGTARQNIKIFGTKYHKIIGQYIILVNLYLFSTETHQLS